MFIPWARKRLGWSLFLGGYALLLFEIYIWHESGRWTPYSLGMLSEWFIHSAAGALERFPYAQPEGIEMWSRFNASDLPHFAARFLKVNPVSATVLVSGYFCIRWEKYLGWK
jgi:hypothetical protein